MNDNTAVDLANDPGATTTTKDVVCGMAVDPAATAHHASHDGHNYHFCSAGCRTKFIAHPEQYLTKAPRAAPEAAPGAMWTCPMHPQIRQPGPGTCPRRAMVRPSHSIRRGRQRSTNATGGSSSPLQHRRRGVWRQGGKWPVIKGKKARSRLVGPGFFVWSGGLRQECRRS